MPLFAGLSEECKRQVRTNLSERRLKRGEVLILRCGRNARLVGCGLPLVPRHIRRHDQLAVSIR